MVQLMGWLAQKPDLQPKAPDACTYLTDGVEAHMPCTGGLVQSF
jgi:hypothetical protein